MHTSGKDSMKETINANVAKPGIQTVQLFLFAFALVVCLALFILHVSLTNKYAVNLPFGDEWGLLSTDDHPVAIDLKWLYEQVNDHRTATTKLYTWLQYHVNGWNLRIQHTVDVVIYGLTLGLFVLFGRKLQDQLPTWTILCFLVFLLSTIIWPDPIAPYAVSVHFWLLFFILSAYFLFTRAQRWLTLILGCFFSILSVYSFASGFVSSSVLLLVFVFFKCDRAIRVVQRERGRELTQLATVVFVIVSSLAVWLIGYRKPAYIPTMAFPNKKIFWEFFLNVLSFSFGIDTFSAGLGIICLLIVLIPICGLVWQQKGRLSRRQWCLSAMALAILADLAAVSIGRAGGFGVAWSKVGEYPEHGMPLILLSAFNWAMFLKAKRTKIAFIAALWLMCFVTFADDWDFGVYARTAPGKLETYRCVQAYYEGTGDGHCRGTFADFPHPEVLLEQARRLKISFYQEMARNIERKPGEPVMARKVYYGAVEVAHRPCVAGWGYDRNAPAAAADSSLTTVHANLARPDVRQAGYGTGQYGFEYATPAFLKDGRPHAISIKSVNGDLLDSPKLLLCLAPKTSP
jgi:hypothetical protein